MPRTRSSKESPSVQNEAGASKSSTSSKYSLGSKSAQPPTIFVLPKKSTKEARIVTLPNPRSGIPSRYLVCPTTGIYEFSRIAAPKSTPRSWLVETNNVANSSDVKKVAEARGQVVSNADLYVATSIDPLFLTLPALVQSDSSRKSDEQRRLFMSIYDHLEKLESEASHMSEILRWEGTRSLLESRMEAACDTADGNGETMFRLNEKKLFATILNKATKMCRGGLAPSMEEKFVTTALEAPVQVQSLKTSDSKQPATGKEASPSSGGSPTLTESVDSQSATAVSQSEQSEDSQGSTAATSVAEEDGEIVSAAKVSDEITNLQRLRVAFDFITSRYVTPTLAKQLSSLLADPAASGIDFAPLNQYHAELVKLRAEAAASRAIGDYTKKHGRDEEEEEARAEKKRKLEEEKKKKANESRATKELKKVNTAGMMKLSAFFKKK